MSKNPPFTDSANAHEVKTFTRIGFTARQTAALENLKAAIDRQEGGDHYKKMKIQPVEYIHANGIGYIEGSVLKYVSRWKNKNGVEDLKKARHFLDLLIEAESKV